MEIEFRPIAGYEGLYECGSDGSIYATDKMVKAKGGSYRHAPRKKLSPTLRKGYPCVALSKNAVKKHICVHTLVATTFIGRPISSNLQVNHIDSNPLNNCVSNLEWVTPQANTDHKLKNGRAKYVTGEKHGKCKYRDSTITTVLSLLNEGVTQSDISRNLDIPLSTINGWSRHKSRCQGSNIVSVSS
jgi:hypothetical protein